ncbi:MAG: helix-turn-helix domain-containing protein [Acidobacteriaceae bacterium]|nr:helix-turn-helix domain-containing protein [Acidobacteriaceae bacterium]
MREDDHEKIVSADVKSAAALSLARGPSPAVVLCPIAVSVEGGAELLGVGRSTVYDLIRKGEIKARKLRGRTLLLIDDLAAFARALPVAR